MDKEKQRELGAKGGQRESASSPSRSGNTRGGSSEQHAKAGRQSHKNS